MRLLNTSTLKLHTFVGEAVPGYAILSHRWDNEEVTFHQLQDGTGQKLPGYSKIRNCCSQAKLDGWQYVWIDSCCIDKTSSAELSESINSMYQWYKDAQVCYAYLADVRRGSKVKDSLRKSAWFKRGWTLQELLAPSIIVFFNSEWVDIGTKGSLAELISEITGIHDFVNFESACVAQKMSWAAGRETTRVEDTAYSLLGLFDVNMPPLYGEGEKAFIRLQLEILKISDDESIFAWAQDNDGGGLLAHSPESFRNSGNIRPLLSKGYDKYGNDKDKQSFFFKDSDPFSMTNKGLNISLLLIPTVVIQDMVGDATVHRYIFVAPLNCLGPGEKENRPAIFLLKTGGSSNEEYKRTLFHKLLLLNPDEVQNAWRTYQNFVKDQSQSPKIFIHKALYIRQESRDHHKATPNLREWIFSINVDSLYEQGFEISECYPIDILQWDGCTQRVFSLIVDFADHGEFPAIKFVSKVTGEIIVLLLGAQDYHHPWAILLAPEFNKALEDIRNGSEFCTPPSRPWQLSGTAVSVDGREAFWESNFRRDYRTKPPLDRLSQPLKDGKSVSVRLRKVGVKNKQQFLIDFTIETGRTLRWPAPAWMKKLSLLFRKHEVAPGTQIGQDIVASWQNRKSMGNKERRGEVEQEEQPIKNNNKLAYRLIRGQASAERRQRETEQMGYSRRGNYGDERIKWYNMSDEGTYEHMENQEEPFSWTEESSNRRRTESDLSNRRDEGDYNNLEWGSEVNEDLFRGDRRDWQKVGLRKRKYGWDEERDERKYRRREAR